jgi:hypothetical protein
VNDQLVGTTSVAHEGPVAVRTSVLLVLVAVVSVARKSAPVFAR